VTEITGFKKLTVEVAEEDGSCRSRQVEDP
jgi:hypothetical protein